MTRREFLPTLAATAATSSGGDMLHQLRIADSIAVFDSSGTLVSWKKRQTELVRSDLPCSGPRLLTRTRRICNHPVLIHKEGSELVYEYAFGEPEPIRVRWSQSLTEGPAGATVLTQTITLRGKARLTHDLIVQIPRTIQVPGPSRKVFLPMKNGIGRIKPVQGANNGDDYVYLFSGTSGGQARPESLAMPLVDEFTDRSGIRIAHFTDLFFTSLFRLPFDRQTGQVQWIYPASIGLENFEEQRTIYTVVHEGGPSSALNAFHGVALKHIKAGPDWLHEIAMTHYDYLSKSGRGWFADLARLERLVPKPERHRVVCTIHGWYDAVGRYTFDPKSRALDRRWIAFPSARRPEVQRLGDELEDDYLPTYLQTPGYRWSRASVNALEPVSMSIAEVRRRIHFAKERGFRTLLYFADGLASSKGLPGIYDDSKVLRWGGWQGPDMAGEAYIQNPLHPDVQAFFKNYLSELLNEYGKEVDGFVWDETSTVRLGAKGTKDYPGYADRAMMRLTEQLSRAVCAAGPLAFLTSDNIGYRGDVGFAPYAFLAHGNFQDSHFRPEACSYGLFPNYRNVFWSCNWAPVSNFEFMKYAVESFDLPVGISNGAFGDDCGIAEMSEGEIKRILRLFTNHTRRQQLHWVEESQPGYSYDGRTIDNRYHIFGM